MKTLLEKAVVGALFAYMGKKGIQQNELAKKLGWSPADLNDTLRGRKSIGKNRQAFLEVKLGAAFRQELLLKISELSESEKKRPAVVAEGPLEFMVGKYILTEPEQNYVGKLVDILRGLNHQAKLAVKTNIDALYHYRKARKEIEEEYLQ